MICIGPGTTLKRRPEDPAGECGSETGRLKLVMFDEITPRLTSNYIVKGVLGDGEMGVVYGESGGGKTFSRSTWRCTSRPTSNGAAGGSGRAAWSTSRPRVGTASTTVLWRSAGDIDIEGRIPFAIVPCAVDLLNPDADTGSLIDLIKMAAERFSMPVKLVVIDTLSRAMAGGNENAPDDMGAYVRTSTASAR